MLHFLTFKIKKYNFNKSYFNFRIDPFDPIDFGSMHFTLPSYFLYLFELFKRINVICLNGIILMLIKQNLTKTNILIINYKYQNNYIFYFYLV
jgi:hypothetical protein